MISVDKVYKTVLYILNKEQRGYVTPAEFNHIAELEQTSIFWSYLKEGQDISKIDQANLTPDDNTFNGLIDIEQKLSNHIHSKSSWSYLGASSNYHTIPGAGWYKQSFKNNAANPAKPVRILNVTAKYNFSSGKRSLTRKCQALTSSEYTKIKASKLTSPDAKNPVFLTANELVNPFSSTTATSELVIGVDPVPSYIYVEGLFEPIAPKWAFEVDPNSGAYLYNSANSKDFQLDASETNKLINNILLKFGVVVRDPSVIQVALQEQAKEAQQ